MEVNELHLCMGCMSPRVAGGKCGVCGYDSDHAPININYLAPGSRISERYLVGKLTSSDTEGAWYVGYDVSNRLRIWVREYAPKAIIMRNYDTGFIEPLTTAEAQYKALMSDFEDLCKSIRRLPRGEKVIPVIDMVYANNTVYAIYQYIKMISLDSFLRRSGGKLSWRHTKKLLMPLYHTVQNVHNAGLIHRGLSPYSVVLDQSGALWLSCFSIAAARTNKSELSAQLYDGFAAPEQYSLNSWQGTWTDVYALGGITYRALTGKNPPAALDRVYGDDLLEGEDVGTDIPEIVVNAVNKSLAVEVEDRTRTAEQLIADLLANEGSNTAIYNAPVHRPYSEQPPATQAPYSARGRRLEEDVRVHQYPNPPQAEYTGQRSGDSHSDGGGFDIMAARRDTGQPAKRPDTKNSGQRPRRKKKKRKSHPVLLLFCSAIVATMLLGFAVYWFTNEYLGDLLSGSSAGSEESVIAQSGVVFSQTDEEAESGKVPKFIGATLESIQSNAATLHRYNFTLKEVFSDEYEEGVIIQQMPSEGDELPDDKSVTLFVSKGPEQIDMPVVVDLPIDDATKLLDSLSIKYEIIPVGNRDYKPDVVAKTDKEPGTKIDIQNDTVILYIKKDMPESVKSSSDEEEEEEDRSESRKASSKASAKASSSKKSGLKPSSKASSSPNGLIKPRSKAE